MDVVSFFKAQADKWNTEEKCGYCWEYDAPLTDAGVNESVMQTDPDECCPVKLFVTNLTYRHNRTYNNLSGFPQDILESIDYTFTLHALVFDDVGTNVYQEQLGHPISESKWETILKPLEDCLCGTEPFDFCDLICKPIQITAWNAVARINWLDNNYTGWSITMTLRDYDCNDSACSGS